VLIDGKVFEIIKARVGDETLDRIINIFGVGMPIDAIKVPPVSELTVGRIIVEQGYDLEFNIGKVFGVIKARVGDETLGRIITIIGMPIDAIKVPINEQSVGRIINIIREQLCDLGLIVIKVLECRRIGSRSGRPRWGADRATLRAPQNTNFRAREKIKGVAWPPNPIHS
jgi:hypothetical protein